MKVMMEEFKRADTIVGQIQAGKKTWADLFERHTFFTKDHKYYLSIIAASRTREAHDTFAGLVQSKVRLLVKAIDEGDSGVAIARPYIKPFERTHHCQNEDEVDRVVQGNLDYVVKKGFPTVLEAKEDNEKNKDIHVIYTSTFYIGLTLPEGGGKSLDISYPVGDFKGYVTGAHTYNPDLMSVRVVHTRNFALPDDVFEPGEVKPTKPPKEKKKKTAAKNAVANAAQVKRSFADTGLDVRTSNKTLPSPPVLLTRLHLNPRAGSRAGHKAVLLTNLLI